MATVLALVEAGSLLLAVCGTIWAWGQPPAGWPDVAGMLPQAVVVCLGCIAAFYLNDLYDLRVVRTFGEFVPRLVQSVGFAFILLATLGVVFPRLGLGGRRSVASLLVVAGFVIVHRALSYAVMRRHPFVERLLLVGVSPLTRKLVQEIEAQPHRAFTIVGIADDGSAGECPGRYPLLGPLTHLDKIVEQVRPHRVVIGMTERRGRLPVPQLLDARMRGILVEDGLHLYERLTGKLAIEVATPSALIFSEDFRKSRLELALGRALSLLVSAAGLVALAPLLALIAIAIKLDSAGPVFFVHERLGLGGRRFRLYKFRTMHPRTGRTSEWARDNSDRITRVGAWLRRFRLDELPQFVNILQGDMNLVGPRPHPVSNAQLFMEAIPYYALRATVRPGVTGWAQIRYGYANDLREETEKMRYDLFYIKHLSLWFDIRVLFETVRTVLFGREEPEGAYRASGEVARAPFETVDATVSIGHALPLRLASVVEPGMGRADAERGAARQEWTHAA
jgi:exopolysaccharide biosynthesis polyprenyl glycosylphosphotransferase